MDAKIKIVFSRIVNPFPNCRKFCCTTCNCLLTELSYLCNGCNFKLCRECYHRLNIPNKSCFKCRTPIENLVQTDPSHKLSSLLIICENFQFGCKDQFPLETLDLHQSKCSYKINNSSVLHTTKLVNEKSRKGYDSALYSNFPTLPDSILPEVHKSNVSESSFQNKISDIIGLKQQASKEEDEKNSKINNQKETICKKCGFLNLPQHNCIQDKIIKKNISTSSSHRESNLPPKYNEKFIISPIKSHIGAQSLDANIEKVQTPNVQNRINFHKEIKEEDIFKFRENFQSFFNTFQANFVAYEDKIEVIMNQSMEKFSNKLDKTNDNIMKEINGITIQNQEIKEKMTNLLNEPLNFSNFGKNQSSPIIEPKLLPNQNEKENTLYSILKEIQNTKSQIIELENNLLQNNFYNNKDKEEKRTEKFVKINNPLSLTESEENKVNTNEINSLIKSLMNSIEEIKLIMNNEFEEIKQNNKKEIDIINKEIKTSENNKPYPCNQDDIIIQKEFCKFSEVIQTQFSHLKDSIIKLKKTIPPLISYKSKNIPENEKGKENENSTALSFLDRDYYSTQEEVIKNNYLFYIELAKDKPSILHIKNMQTKDIFKMNLYLNDSSVDAAYSKHSIYICGGHNSKKYLSLCFKYSLLTRKFESSANLTVERCGVSLIPTNNYIFSIGGFNGQCVKICEYYNLKNNLWSQISNLNHPDSGITGFYVIPNSMYKFGGSETDIIEKLNFDGIHMWEIISICNSSNREYGCTFILNNDEVLIFGGYGASDSFSIFNSKSSELIYTKKKFVHNYDFNSSKPVLFRNAIWIINVLEKSLFKINVSTLEFEELDINF